MKFSPRFLIPIFSCFYVASASAVTVNNLKRSATAIEADLSALNSNLTLYDTDLHTFLQESGNLLLSLELHTIANTSLNAFDATSSAIAASGPLSSTDATTIEQAVQEVSTTLTDICQTILANLNSTSNGSIVTREPPTTTPVGGPVPPVHPVGSLGTGDSTPTNVLVADLTSLRNAFINLLDLLGGSGEAPASVATQFAAVKTTFLNLCGAVPA